MSQELDGWLDPEFTTESRKRALFRTFAGDDDMDSGQLFPNHDDRLQEQIEAFFVREPADCQQIPRCGFSFLACQQFWYGFRPCAEVFHVHGIGQNDDLLF